MSGSIRVNGIEISDAAIAAEVQYHPASTLAEAHAAAARALVVRELLMQEAASRGIDPAVLPDASEPAEEARIRALLADQITMPEADEASCRRFYDANRRRFRSPDMYEGAHILFAAEPDDAAARNAAKEKAAEALRRILAEPSCFAALARDLSACPSGASGGLLGQLTRGDSVPEFETFMLNLEEGQVCPIPVETRYGIHVIRLDRKIAGRDLPFDAVRERIADYLRDHVWRRAVSQYIRILAGRAEIEGIEMEGAGTPLVQ